MRCKIWHSINKVKVVAWGEQIVCVLYWLRVCIVFTAPSFTGCSSANVSYFCEFLHHVVCEYGHVCTFVCSCALYIVAKCVCLCLVSLLLFLSAVVCLPRECVINRERRVIIQMFACLVTVLLDIFIHSWVLLRFRAASLNIEQTRLIFRLCCSYIVQVKQSSGNHTSNQSEEWTDKKSFYFSGLPDYSFYVNSCGTLK